MNDATETPLFQEAVTRERNRFLAEVRTYVTERELPDYAAVLDDFIRWSLGRDELAHVEHKGSQGKFEFVLARTGQVFWAAYPLKRDDHGAKFVVLTRRSNLVPDSVRDEVRRRFAQLDSEAETQDVPTLSFRKLFRPAARTTVTEVLADALSAIRSVN
jgi:hypothetical protein